MIGDSHRHQTQSNGPEDQPLAGAGDRDVGDLSRERGIAGILGVHEGDSVLEIQRVNDVGLALVQVHRAWVRCGRGLTDAHAAQEPPGSGLHDDDLATDSPRTSTAACGFTPGAGKYLPFRRRNSPSSTRLSATSTAPQDRTSASSKGSSVAAQSNWGPSRCGLTGSITTRSTGLSNNAAGWWTKYVSSGSSRAINTTSAPWPRRPDRPACCQNEATVPGKPASTTASSPAISTPNSKALVVASPRSWPSARAWCSALRSSAR